ncbi:MAG: LysM peptidoglycan-binding domain-containing protein [Opitutaceae bacterium]
MGSNLLRAGSWLVVLTTAAWGQTYSEVRVELANLRQDMLLLTQRVGELSMTVEQLTRDNSSLQNKANQSYATIEQLNKAVTDINRTLQAGLAEQKRDTLNHVSAQMERLARQTQAAIDALAKNQATRPALQTSFSEEFPKEGINYTIQAGDTLSGIAKKNGAKLSDVRNANKIADDTRIRVGQTLFIPQGK